MSTDRAWSVTCSRSPALGADHGPATGVTSLVGCAGTGLVLHGADGPTSRADFQRQLQFLIFFNETFQPLETVVPLCAQGAELFLPVSEFLPLRFVLLLRTRKKDGTTHDLRR